MNTKETQRSIACAACMAAVLSAPADLMDTLFVNHRYEVIHWGRFTALRLGIVLFLVLLAVAQASRALQKVALALFLGAAVGIAIVTRLSVQATQTQTVAKWVILLWWIGVCLLIADWIRAKMGAVHTLRLHKVPIQPNSPADKAREFMLERLQRQAADSGLALSDIEQRFLDYSRIPSKKAALALEEAFFQTHDYKGFKNRIRTLMKDAVKHDRENDPRAQKEYYKLLRDLKRAKHDQQLAMMVERGILDARSGAEEARDWALYIATGLSIVGLLTGFVWMVK